MRVGIDSSIVIAGIHANHPLHGLASDWLIRNISDNQLVIAHHSILEVFTILTRLSGVLRITVPEVKRLLEETVLPNMEVADFSGFSIWDVIDSLVSQGIEGEQTFNAYTVEILTRAGVEAIATFHASEFMKLAPHLTVINPLIPS